MRIKIILGLVVLIVVLLLLFSKTGFLQKSFIDNRDLEKWDYTNNQIVGSEEFRLQGNHDYCWILIHSYTATPKEMKELGHSINTKFNDTVYAIRLSGSGQAPSQINDKSLEIWYEEVQSVYIDINNECNNVNVVGSSLGADLAMKLAEEKNLGRLYLVNPFLITKFKPLFVFSSLIHFVKKGKVAQINDERGLNEHIAYTNMPLNPIKNSFSFIEERIQNINRITEQTMILHSINDKASSLKNAKMIFDNINSTNKKIIWFNQSNHILLMDYDKEAVIKSILDFELSAR